MWRNNMWGVKGQAVTSTCKSLDFGSIAVCHLKIVNTLLTGAI